MIKETSEIIEEAVTAFKVHEEGLKQKIARFSSFSPEKQAKEATEEIILKERVIRFHCEKVGVVISEVSTGEDTIERMSEEIEDTGSSGFMRESTKYDLAVSEKTSVYSSNIGFGKAQYEDSIDLIWFEVTNVSLKFDLCPKNSKQDDPKLSELFKMHSIPEIKGNLGF